MKKILITGASGFLGLSIVRELAKQRNYEIYAVTSGRQTTEFPKGVINVTANLLDREQSKSVIEKVRPEVMLHLAWELSQADYLNSQNNLVWLEESLYMLRTFISVGGKYFAFSGSSAEYGHFTGFAETGIIVKRSLYGQCKLSFHEMATKVSQEENIKYVNLRFFPILGKGVRKNIAIAKAVIAFAAKEKFICKAPYNIWDFISVYDAARATYEIISQDYTGIVNIAGGKPQMMGEVFKNIAKKMSCEQLVVLEDTNNRSEILVADTEVLNQKIGYHCSVDIDKMLDDTITSLQKEG